MHIYLSWMRFCFSSHLGQTDNTILFKLARKILPFMTFYYWHWHFILPSADSMEGMYIISNSCFFDSLFCTSVITYRSATAIIRKNLFFVIVMIPNCTNTIWKHAKRLDLHSSWKLINSGSSDLKNKQISIFQKVSVQQPCTLCIFYAVGGSQKRDPGTLQTCD